MQEIIQKEITQVIKRIEILANNVDLSFKDSEVFRRDLASLREKGVTKENKGEIVSKIKSFTELQTKVSVLSQAYMKNIFYIQELLKIAALVGFEPELNPEFEKAFPPIKELYKEVVIIDTDKNEVLVSLPEMFSKEMEDVPEEVVLNFLNNPLFQAKK